MAVGGGTITTLTTTSDITVQGVTVGRGAGAVATNTAVGASALAANTTGSYNTSAGYQALKANLGGAENTAVGGNAGLANTTGSYNSVFGTASFVSNTTGASNTGVGHGTLGSNTTGSTNTAVGRDALQANTTASNNTAVGYQAGYSNTTGEENIFIGRQAGYSNTTAGFNTFVGDYAGQASTGIQNTFVGSGAGYLVTTGTKNTILGKFNGNGGGLDIRTASNYIVLSDGDGTPRSYCDGNGTWTTANAPSSGVRTSQINNNGNTSGNQCLGLSLGTNTNNTSSYLIVANAAGADRMYVYGNGNIVNSNNSYGTLSDAKLKENIVDATPKLADLMQVKVRNYNLIGDQQKQIGVVAQELEQVFPGMIDESLDKDAEGNDIETTTKSVKMSVFVPILIKAIQELKAEVDSLKAQINGASA
jgi:hypothetical protein